MGDAFHELEYTLNYCFVSGMFRSGTTMIARMLNTHPSIACASDPMRPLFNSFRTDVLHGCQHHEDRFAPLEDYCFTRSNLLRSVLNADFTLPVACEPEKLLEVVRNRAVLFSGKWARTLSLPERHSTYEQWIEHFLDHVEKTYGKDGTHRAVAFKEVWTNEMVPAFLRSFPHGKAVILVRDPRAVAASKAKTEPYPLFFQGQQWRKLAFLGWWLAKQYPDRVLLLRYEDIVSEPERHVSALCRFLEVDFDESLLDLSNYRDGNGEPWRRNSSYSSVRNSFDTSSVAKWTKVLQERDVALLELIAFDVMRAFGYAPQFDVEQLLAWKTSDMHRYSPEELPDWIVPYSFDHDEHRFVDKVVQERMRLGYVSSGNNMEPEELFALQTCGPEVLFHE